MPIKFVDKDGNFLAIGRGGVDPDKLARIKKFPAGWTFSEITEQEAKFLIPFPKSLYDPRTPVERKVDEFIDVLEDELQKPRGYLREKIKGNQK